MMQRSWIEVASESRAVAMAAVVILGLSTLGGYQAELQSLRNRGQAAFEEKRFAEAEAAFVAANAEAGATAADRFNLALARYELNDDSGALAALESAAQIDPDLTAAHYLRGLIHRRGSALEAARESLERAELLDPTDPAVVYNLGATLEALDRDAAARDRFERVIAMGFDVGLQHYVSSLYRTGFLLRGAGDLEAARPYLENYQQQMRRLSQAQRAPSASEAGRHKRVIVPVNDLGRPDPDTAAALRFTASAGLATSGNVLVGDLGAGPTLVVLGHQGAVVEGEVTTPTDLPEGTGGLGDFDRDGHDDLLVLAVEGATLLRNTGTPAARFEPVTAVGLVGIDQVTGIEWVDSDHDGDLDVLVTSAEGTRLFANHGAGTFVEATEQAGFAATAALQVLPADFDLDSDTDLYVVGDGVANQLYTNARGGRFEEIAGAVGAAGERGDRRALAEDFNNDGFVDLVVAGATGVRLMANNGNGTFARPAVVSLRDDIDELFAADLNNDGYLDLVVGGDPVEVIVNMGGGRFRATPIVLPGRVRGVADVNFDGALDLAVEAERATAWHVQPAPLASWIEVRLEGIKNNLNGIGARVEVKAAGGYQLRTVRSERVHFGLGDATIAEVVRITWPNGIVQNEVEVAARTLLGPVLEVERLEGSCPLLYTWDGTEWRFINEVLGVAPLGMPLAAGVIHPADFDEFVPVPGGALQSRDGEFELRFTEELREAGFLDAIRLIAVDHPANVRLIPDERFVPPPHPEFRLFVVEDPLPVRARTDAGVDVSPRLALADGDWVGPAVLGPYDGLAAPHGIEFELAAVDPVEPVRLFLTGWVYWATGSANLVVDDDPRFAFEPVRLEVPDGRGGWRVAIDDIGLPNAKNSTLAVDLTGLIDSQDPRVRVTTTMRLYWDAAFYTVGGDHPAGIEPVADWAGAWGVPAVGTPRMSSGDGLARLHVLAPASADIRFRGFSRLVRGTDGFETFDYAAVSMDAPWNQHPGNYTRYGAVGELLDAADDRYVVVGTGDEVAVRFADTLPPVAEGWSRDWLVYLNGWVKDGDPNTVHGDRVEPLPFHSMSSYPYRLDETYPDDPTHAAYELGYNTRPARKIQVPLNRR